MPLQIDRFSYDEATGVIKKQNKEYKLTKLQKKLFDYFLAHPKQIIEKETLMQEVWGRIVTDNTINKFISALRLYVEEDSSQPKIIVTHFGHGISFEGTIKNQQNKSGKNKKKLSLFFLLILAIVFGITYSLFNKKAEKIAPTDLQLSLNDKQHILILPTEYEDVNIDDLHKTGLDELLKTTFNQANTEGQVVFNPAKLNNRQSIEKYWQVDKEILILQSKVIKNGDIYESVMRLSKGANVVMESSLSNPNLDELLKYQMDKIASYQNAESDKSLITQTSINNKYLQALAYKKQGKTKKAKALLQESLQQNSDNYQARFELALLLLEEKDYTQALSQLKTLKNTSLYRNLSAEIELAIAKINYQQHDYVELIAQLKKYQASHTDISEVKKAKIKIQLADAYRVKDELSQAMKFYKQALLSIDEEFNPGLFAKSYYGQAMILEHDSNNQTVYDTFDKALQYAKVAGAYDLQVLALDEMAKILLVSNQWEKGITLKKQALEIMELNDDKSKVAGGLGTLAAYLIQAGHFTEAKKINNRLGKIAKEIKNDVLYLNYLHYDAVLLMNVFKFAQARHQIDQQLQLARQSNNIGMQLDNAFLEFELQLAQKDTSNFKNIWDERLKMLNKNGLQRYRVYMNYYLARFYKQSGKTAKAIKLIGQITEQAKANNDIKIVVDTQNQLAEIYTKSNPPKALEILNNLEQYKPDANPYLELKALVYYELGNKTEALNLLNQAKLVFHDAWKSENQVLLEKLQKELK